MMHVSDKDFVVVLMNVLALYIMDKEDIDKDFAVERIGELCANLHPVLLDRKMIEPSEVN